MKSLYKVVYVSLGMMILYMAFSSTQFMISQIYSQLGYDQLGSISLITLYVFQALSNFFIPMLLRTISLRLAFTISALGFIPFIAVGILPRICYEENLVDVTQSDSFLCTKLTIYSAIILTSAVCGIAVSALWISQGQYIGILSITSSPSFGLFGCVFAFQYVLGSLLAVFILGLSGQKLFFIVMTLVGCLSIIIFSFTPSAHQTDSELDITPSTSAYANLEVPKHSFKSAYRGMKDQFSVIFSCGYIVPLTVMLGLLGVYLTFNMRVFSSLISQTLSTSDGSAQPSFQEINTKTCIVFFWQGIFSLIGGFIGTHMSNQGYSLYKYTTLGMIFIQLGLILALYAEYMNCYIVLFFVGSLIGGGDYFMNSFFNQILAKQFQACSEIFAYKNFLNSLLFLLCSIVLNVLDNNDPANFIIITIIYTSLAIFSSLYIKPAKSIISHLNKTDLYDNIDNKSVSGISAQPNKRESS